MIIRLTTKAKKQLFVSSLQKVNSTQEKEFFVDWNIDVVFIAHKKYFMLTEGKTLFSILKHAKAINNVGKFELLMGNVLAEVLNSLVEDLNLETLVISNIIYATTENNNVRRAQIDHLYHAKHLVENKKNTFGINNIPIASIGFKTPADYFIQELGKILIKDGRVFVEDISRN